MTRCAFQKYYLNLNVEGRLDIDRHAAKTSQKTLAEREGRHHEILSSGGAVTTRGVDSDEMEEVILAWLQVEVERQEYQRCLQVPVLGLLGCRLWT